MAAVPTTRTFVGVASKPPYSQNETGGFNKRLMLGCWTLPASEGFIVPAASSSAAVVEPANLNEDDGISRTTNAIDDLKSP